MYSNWSVSRIRLSSNIKSFFPTKKVFVRYSVNYWLWWD